MNKEELGKIFKQAETIALLKARVIKAESLIKQIATLIQDNTIGSSEMRSLIRKIL